jgi:toxin ParE1/3/4
MRVPAVLRTARARRDLLEIWSYVADRSGPERADKLLNRIDERCDRLAELPGMGRLRPDLGPGFRGYTVPRTKYIVVYRQTRDGIEILRVVHGARSLPELFES